MPLPSQFIHSTLNAGRKLLYSIALAILYGVSCGLPFYYHPRISRRIHAPRDTEPTDVARLDPPHAEAWTLGGLIKGWKTVRLATSFLCTVDIAILTFSSYYHAWGWTWLEFFLVLSIVFSATSFISSNMLLFYFADWSGNTTKLKDQAWTWSAVFSMPAASIVWGAVSLMIACIILVVQKITVGRLIPGDNSQTMLTVVMAIFGIVITLLFYIVNLIRRL